MTWTGSTPVNGRALVEGNGFDGIRTDRDGNVWAGARLGRSGFDGVHCYSPDGSCSARSICPSHAPTSASAGPRRIGCS